jgi:anaerobic dimethyl sulfoxide reductase subunit A
MSVRLFSPASNHEIDSYITITMNEKSIIKILAVVMHYSLSDTLTQILSQFTSSVDLKLVHQLQDIPMNVEQDYDIILADISILLDEKFPQGLNTLSKHFPDIPVIALLPFDTPEFRDNAIRHGVNGIVPTEKSATDLIPTIKRLLSRASTKNWVKDKIEHNAYTSAPRGESAFTDEKGVSDLQIISDRTVERLSTPPQSLNTSTSILSKPSPPTSEKGSIFLRSLQLTSSFPEFAEPEVKVRTACNLNCGSHFCGMEVSIRKNRIVRIEPASFPDSRYRKICLKGISHLQNIYHPDRLLHPLKRIGARGNGNWEQIFWDQALNEISTKIITSSETHGPESLMFFMGSGQLSALNGITGAYLRLASLLGASGTSLSEFGLDSAIPSGIEDTFGKGSGYLANDFADLVNSRLVLIWGADPAQTQMNWWSFFHDAQQAGTRLITIDPQYTFTAGKSDQWLPIRPGTDLYLALAMLNIIIDRNWIDRNFLLKHTIAPLLVRQDNKMFLRLNNSRNENEAFAVWDHELRQIVAVDQGKKPKLTGSHHHKGVRCYTAFDLLKKMVSPYTPELAAEKTGLTTEQIVSLADAFANTKPARIFTLYGIDRWHHGATFGRLIATLSALTGNLCVPGAGAGVGGSNESPIFVTDFTHPGGKEHRPISPAKLPEQILSGKPYPIKAMWIAFSNWLNQWPEKTYLQEEILPKIDLLVVVDQFLTETARSADYVLPAATLFEREDLVKGPGPYFQYQPQILPPVGECKSDFDIASLLADRLGVSEGFSQSPSFYLSQIMDESKQDDSDPSFQSIKENGVVARRISPDDLVAHRSLHFNTPTGRVEFYVERLIPHKHELPEYEPPIEAETSNPKIDRYPLMCITKHSRYRVHSSFVNTPWLRELEEEPQATLHPNTAKPRGIINGNLVKVFNDRGYVILKACLSLTVPPGTVYLDQGWQSGDFHSGHSQTLTHGKGNPTNRFGPNISFSDVLVEVVPWQDGGSHG